MLKFYLFIPFDRALFSYIPSLSPFSHLNILHYILISSFLPLVDEPPSTSSKKKHLTDSELALRREETARKRKNMSEKKLEDEKVRCVVFPSSPLFFFGFVP